MADRSAPLPARHHRRVGLPALGTLPLAALAAVGATLTVLPLAGLLARAPWRSLPAKLATHQALDALRISLVTSLAALAGTLLLGVPLAWLLARTTFPGRSLVRALVTVPLVLPPVVGGVALLLAFGRNGLLGRPLDAIGVRLPFTTAGAAVAEAFVALPFLVLTLEGAIAGLDRRYEDVAGTLGAGPGRVFRQVTLPMVGPALAAGAALAWARALGEFGATITFAGNLPGRTQTLPLAVYLALQSDPDVAVALSIALLAVSVAVIAAVGGRWLARR